MNKEQIKMKKNIEEYKAKTGEKKLFDEHKEKAASSQKNKKSDSRVKFKDLWPPSDESKK